MGKRGMVFWCLFLLLGIFLLAGVEAVQYANCAAVPSAVLGGRTCSAFSSCTSLSGTNQYFLLTADISSAGSCLTFEGTNNVLDLNEHKVVFGGSGSSNVGVEFNTCSYCKLTNGNISQGPGGGTVPFAIRSGGSPISHSEISYLNISYYGDDGSGMMDSFNDLMNIANTSIHHNRFDMGVTYVSNRQNTHAAIGVDVLDGMGAKIYNNIIRGRGHTGISITPQGGASFYYPTEVYNNNISYTGSAVNSIAMANGGNSASASTRSRYVFIHDNFINMTRGKGIYTGGGDAGTYGLADSMVYNNYIETRDNFTGEGTLNFAVRIRYGALNMTFFNNTLISKMEDNNDFTPRTLAIAEGPPHGGDIKIINNTIIERAFAPAPVYHDYPTALWLTGPQGEYSASFSKIYFEGNRFVSDDYILIMPGSDGYLNGSLWINNTFERGPESVPGSDLFRMGFGGEYWGYSENNTFIDAIFGSGVSWNDISYDGNYIGGSYYFKWTTHVKVRNTALIPIQGALVTIKDKDGNTIFSNQATDSQGYFKTILQEFSVLNSPSKIFMSPYNISVLYNGERQVKYPVYVNKTLTGANEIVFVFDMGGNSPDVNSDGVINVVDIAIVVFNQGRTLPDTRYAHLDLNEDGAINWQDVQIVVNAV